MVQERCAVSVEINRKSYALYRSVALSITFSDLKHHNTQITLFYIVRLPLWQLPPPPKKGRCQRNVTHFIGVAYDSVALAVAQCVSVHLSVHVALYQYSRTWALLEWNFRTSHLSVCWFVCLECALRQNGWLDPDAVWGGEWCRSWDRCRPIRGASICPKGKGVFEGFAFP